MLIGELLAEAGLPAGVLNIVNGDKEAVDVLLTDERVQSVSFVGSTPIAEYIYATASAHGKRCQALGGAKNHMVVMPDADPQQVVSSLMGAAYGSAGERCMAISVAVCVDDEVADKLVEMLKGEISQMRTGPGLGVEPEPHMGPLVTREHQQKVSGYIDLGVEEGATPSATAAASRSRATRKASMSARRCSTGSRRACASTARKSSARCWPWCGLRRSTRRCN